MNDLNYYGFFGEVGFEPIRPPKSYTVTVSDKDNIIKIENDGSLLAELSLHLKDNVLFMEGKDGTELADAIELPVGVKELIKQSYNKEEQLVELTFLNTDGSETVFEIEVSDLVNVYQAGAGLSLDEETNTFSIKISDESGNVLSADEEGLDINLTDYATIEELSALTETLNSELEELTNLDSEIVKALEDETSARTTSDENLFAMIEDEIENRLSGDTDLKNYVEEVSETFQADIDSLVDVSYNLLDKINEEVDRATNAENKINDTLDELLNTSGLTEFIDTFKDVEDFLKGFTDKENLVSLLKDLSDELKEDSETKSNEVLQSAKDYAEELVEGIGIGDYATISAMTEADNSVLDNAKAYTDAAIEGLNIDDYATISAMTEADNSVLDNAKAYTDVAIEGLHISDYATLSAMTEADNSVLDNAKAYTDAAIDSLDIDDYATISAMTEADNSVLEEAKAYSDGLASNYDVAGAASTAEQNAKDYTDAAIESINIDDYAKLSVMTEADNSVLDNAKAYADGLASNYDVAGAASTAEQNAKDYTDAAIEGLHISDYATLSVMTEADNAVLDNAKAYTDDELTKFDDKYATKTYVDEQDEATLLSAKTYTDTLASAISDNSTKINRLSKYLTTTSTSFEYNPKYQGAGIVDENYIILHNLISGSSINEDGGVISQGGEAISFEMLLNKIAELELKISSLEGQIKSLKD